MIKNNIKYFVIGSTILTYFMLVIAVYLMPEEYKNYKFDDYLTFVPVGVGLYSMLSFNLQKVFEWSNEARIFYMTIIGSVCVSIFAKCNGFYNFTDDEWAKYNIGLTTMYLFMNLIIYTLQIILKVE